MRLLLTLLVSLCSCVPTPVNPIETEPLIQGDAECAFEGIRHVEVPAGYSKHSQMLNLRYRVFPGTRPDAPTVVVIPGGPGQNIMQNTPRAWFALGAIPEDYTTIYTDARGSGCNTFPSLAEPDEEVFTTENTARDVLAIIRQEGLQDYFLYGASFGTAQATITAALANTDGGPIPRRIILEGALGHAFDSFEQYFSAYQSEWSRVLPSLDPAWEFHFKKEPWSTTLYWSREQWGMFVSAQLILGDYPGQGHMLHYWLNGLSRKDSNAQSYVSTFMAGVGKTEPSPMFRTIACREIWGEWKAVREIRDGQLQAIGSDLCEGMNSRTALFDSKNWLVSSPITYFNGPYDPTTTTNQTDYHFKHQTEVERQYITVPNAAHAPLTLGLAARNCATDVWRAFEADAKALENALSNCTRPGEKAVEMLIAPPGT